MHLRLGQNLKEGFTASWGEEDVTLAPEYDRLGLMFFEECLPLRIEFNVGPIVVEEVELDLLRVRAFEKMVVHIPVVRADELWIGMTRCVDSIDSGRLKEASNRLLSFGRTPFPIVGPQSAPDLRETDLVRVGVLNNQPLKPVWMFIENTETNRAAVILDVETERVNPTFSRNFVTIAAVLSKV